MARETAGRTLDSIAGWITYAVLSWSPQEAERILIGFIATFSGSCEYEDAVWRENVLIAGVFGKISVVGVGVCVPDREQLERPMRFLRFGVLSHPFFSFLFTQTPQPTAPCPAEA